MKLFITIFITFIASLSLVARAPQSFQYQAVVRNDQGKVISNEGVRFRISIIKSSLQGKTVYTETHLDSTNAYGVVTLAIGRGTSDDTFSAIDWRHGPYYIQVELDTSGGSNYRNMGTSQLLSVPYALHAQTSQVSNVAKSLQMQGADGKFYRVGIDSSGNLYTMDLDSREAICGTYEEDKLLPNACYDAKECLIGKWRFQAFIDRDSCIVEYNPDSVYGKPLDSTQYDIPWIEFHKDSSLDARTMRNKLVSSKYWVTSNNTLQFYIGGLTTVNEPEWGRRFYNELFNKNDTSQFLGTENKFVVYKDRLFIYNKKSKFLCKRKNE